MMLLSELLCDFMVYILGMHFALLSQAMMCQHFNGLSHAMT